MNDKHLVDANSDDLKQARLPIPPLRLSDLKASREVTIAEAVEMWLDFHRAFGTSPCTIEQYSYQMARLQEHFDSELPLRAIQKDQIRDFQAWLRDVKGLAPNTVLNTRRALNSLLNWAAAESHIESSPSRSFPKPKVPKRLLPPLSQGQVETLLQALKGSSIFKLRNRALIYLMLDAGLRRSEVVGMKVGDVDLETSQVLVIGKGNKQRMVFLGKAALCQMRAYCRLRKGVVGEPLWLTIQGPLTQSSLQHIIRSLSKRVGFHFTPHTLRRTFAIMSLRNGADLLSVSRQLGHSDLTTTTVYLDQDSSDLKRVHDATSPIDCTAKTRLGRR